MMLNVLTIEYKRNVLGMIAVTAAVVVAGETPVRRMLGVLQTIISGQQPDMRAVHKLHELIVSGDITGDVSVSAELGWLLIANV